uniref:NBS-containing resistance-like protein n=1 Tax=Tanacetum cinerariifolium TaxID=118510 RepID=A0A699ITV8_TANCI|nr:NBS-containing resistance-like protein [Tanacetum cinerariifolium]
MAQKQPAPSPTTSPPSTHNPTPAENPQPQTHPMITRSQVGTFKPNPRFHSHTWHISPLPKSPYVALSNPQWRDHKYHVDGLLSMYKARFVANGRNQQYRVDCSDTFSPVVKPATIRTVLSLALARNWHVHQLDVKNAFLNGDLTETIYMYQPSGFVDSLFPHHFNAYTDVDWAGCPVTRMSTFGYCVFLGDNTLSWSAKCQVTLSRSSAEAEYRGVANVVAKTAWIRNWLRELHNPLFTSTLVYCDNVSAVYMSTNPFQHQRTKHIEIDIHFVCDMVARGQVRVLHVPSRYQYADIFTKGLSTTLFEEFCTSLSVRSSPAQTTREC